MTIRKTTDIDKTIFIDFSIRPFFYLTDCFAANDIWLIGAILKVGSFLLGHSGISNYSTATALLSYCAAFSFTRHLGHPKDAWQ